MEDVKGSLQSKKGRQQVLDTLTACKNGLAAQPLFETIERLEGNIKAVEKQLRSLAAGERMVELLMTIPGCGEICSWTIRAYPDDIKRFANPKKYASFAGMAPWVQNSNERIHHGSITKRGPQELRTAIVQVVMGLRRMKEKAFSWRFMQRYAAMKKNKGSGRAIIATARKMARVIGHMLSEDAAFDTGLMIDRKLAKKSESMSRSESMGKETGIDEEGTPVIIYDEKKCDGAQKRIKASGVAGKKRKKLAKR